MKQENVVKAKWALGLLLMLAGLGGISNGSILAIGFAIAGFFVLPRADKWFEIIMKRQIKPWIKYTVIACGILVAVVGGKSSEQKPQSLNAKTTKPNEVLLEEKKVSEKVSENKFADVGIDKEPDDIESNKKTDEPVKKIDVLKDSCSSVYQKFIGSKLTEVQKKEEWTKYEGNGFDWQLQMLDLSDFFGSYTARMSCAGSKEMQVEVEFSSEQKDVVLKLDKGKTYSVRVILEKYSELADKLAAKAIKGSMVSKVKSPDNRENVKKSMMSVSNEACKSVLSIGNYDQANRLVGRSFLWALEVKNVILKEGGGARVRAVCRGGSVTLVVEIPKHRQWFAEKLKVGEEYGFKVYLRKFTGYPSEEFWSDDINE